MSRRVKVVKQEVGKIPVDSGKGLPTSVLARVASTKPSFTKSQPTSKFQGLLNEPFDTFNVADHSQAPEVSEYSMLMNLDEYDFPDDEQIDPHHLDVNMDVTALDRYNEDVRKYRHALLESCRLLPPTGDINSQLLERVRLTVQGLCRSCYYGTPKAQRLASCSILIMIWLLNKRNVPIMFQMRILQSTAEMVWTSGILKRALAGGHGIKVIARLLRSGILHHADLGCWAAYALLAACVGCADVIAIAQDLENMDEYVGEITFPYYWREWPANFGLILQGVLFGPHSVTAFDEEFTFL